MDTNQQLSVLERVRAHLLTWLLPIIGAALLALLLLIEQRLATLVPQPAEIWAVRAIAVSLLLLGLLGASYFWFRPKFKHLPRLGVHQNIKTGEYFCSHCLITKKLHSPLKSLKDNFGWQCSSCGKWEKNPDYIEPDAPKANRRERI